MTAIVKLRNESLSSNSSVFMSLSELNKFENLASLVSELKLKNEKLRSELDDLKLKINNPDTNSSSIKTSLITHVTQEIFEREKCAFNTIIYGITESVYLTTTQRISDDRIAIDRILKPFGNVIPTSAKVIRLSKAFKDNTRSIKIIFDKKEKADDLFFIFVKNNRNRSNIPKKCLSMISFPLISRRLLIFFQLTFLRYTRLNTLMWMLINLVFLFLIYQITLFLVLMRFIVA